MNLKPFTLLVVLSGSRDMPQYQISQYRTWTNTSGGELLENIFLVPSDSATNSVVQISFENSSELGYVHLWYDSSEVNVAMVKAYLPSEEFNRIYHLLQTEKPIYVTWNASIPSESTAGWQTSTPLLSFQLSTGPEPIGEGYADILSP